MELTEALRIVRNVHPDSTAQGWDRVEAAKTVCAAAERCAEVDATSALVGGLEHCNAILASLGLPPAKHMPDVATVACHAIAKLKERCAEAEARNAELAAQSLEYGAAVAALAAERDVLKADNDSLNRVVAAMDNQRIKMGESHRQTLDNTEVILDVVKALAAERDALCEQQAAHWRMDGEAHETPCTYGTLCPYCEIAQREYMLTLERKAHATTKALLRDAEAERDDEKRRADEAEARAGKAEGRTEQENAT